MDMIAKSASVVARTGNDDALCPWGEGERSELVTGLAGLSRDRAGRKRD